MKNNKAETKRFYTLKELQEYIDTLNVLDNTKVYTIDIRDKLHDEYKPRVNKEELTNAIRNWAIQRKVTHNPDSNVFTTNKFLLTDFNNWNSSNISAKVFIPLFRKVGADANQFPEERILRVNRMPQQGFIGVKINGFYSKEL
ncbi:hypothetical protein vBEfS_L1000036 [Enterococcus phage vB_EfS_L1]|nr:hypothetical protein vBEfS_L1000036 [Enterococcus phage vB_EfS_L1]